ncbi:MAG: hypothetical protein IPP15_13130 [Saprospiraceae bacterium]|uniref:Uncharacterized protein n=1 Tax=Candidatus Opimibacter skivensis TaxID=2982028 RepID=A0A9D7SWK5_9BACT|nr:hypothetical protein [Candidatus Opimibacter skivensis]
MKTFHHLFWLFVFLAFTMHPVCAQKSNVEVTFSVLKNTPFYVKYKRDMTVYQKQALDTLVRQLNEYIAFANFVKTSHPQKLKIELMSEKNSENNSLSDHYLLFTFDPGDGSEVNTYKWDYIDFNELNHLSSNVNEALDNLSQKWIEHLSGHYDEGLTKELFTNLYLILPSQEHYTSTFRAVFPESKKELKLNTELSMFTVSIEYNDDPDNFIPQNNIVYREDFKDNITVGPFHLKGCVCVQLTPWESNHNPVRGKVYFKEYKRKVYESLSPQ